MQHFAQHFAGALFINMFCLTKSRCIPQPQPALDVTSPLDTLSRPLQMNSRVGGRCKPDTQTVADGCEHKRDFWRTQLCPQTSQVKREPPLRIREKRPARRSRILRERAPFVLYQRFQPARGSVCASDPRHCSYIGVCREEVSV